MHRLTYENSSAAADNVTLMCFAMSRRPSNQLGLEACQPASHTAAMPPHTYFCHIENDRLGSANVSSRGVSVTARPVTIIRGMR